MVGGDEMRRNRFDRSKDDIVFDSINYCLMTAVLVIVLYPLVYILGVPSAIPIRWHQARCGSIPSSLPWKGTNIC